MYMYNYDVLLSVLDYITFTLCVVISAGAPQDCSLKREYDILDEISPNLLLKT